MVYSLRTLSGVTSRRCADTNTAAQVANSRAACVRRCRVQNSSSVPPSAGMTGLERDALSQEAAPAATGASQKLSRFALTGMVVGSMVGAGIFSLPRTFGAATGPFGAIIAWLIAGTGMYMLA